MRKFQPKYNLHMKYKLNKRKEKESAPLLYLNAKCEKIHNRRIKREFNWTQLKKIIWRTYEANQRMNNTRNDRLLMVCSIIVNLHRLSAHQNFLTLWLDIIRFERILIERRPWGLMSLLKRYILLRIALWNKVCIIVRTHDSEKPR